MRSIKNIAQTLRVLGIFALPGLAACRSDCDRWLDAMDACYQEAGLGDYPQATCPRGSQADADVYRCERALVERADCSGADGITALFDDMYAECSADAGSGSD